MSTNFMIYVVYGCVGILVLIGIAYFILNKLTNKSDYKQLQKMREGTKTSSFSMEIIYQLTGILRER